MRIILTQAEIEEAIEKLILEQVDVPDDERIDIDLKATRGEEGYQAFIDFVDVNAPAGSKGIANDERINPVEGAENLSIAAKVIAAKAAIPVRRGRPLGSKNKPQTDAQPAVNAAAQGETLAAVAEPVVEQTTATVTGSHDPAIAPTTPYPAPEPVVEAPVSLGVDADPSEVQVANELTENVENTDQETALALDNATFQAVDGTSDGSNDAPVEAVEDNNVLNEEQNIPAPTVTQTDVSTQANETLTEQVSEPVTEAPVEEVPATPTRSLFANIGR